MKFNNQYDNRPETIGEQFTSPSKTIPNQAFTVKQIIDRTNKGLPITGVKVPVYNDDGELPDIRNMDLSELHELKQRLQTAEKNAKKQLADLDEKKRIQETEEFYKRKFQTQQPKTDE